MVAVQILDQLHHPVLQGVNDRVNLLTRSDELNHLLQSTRAMGVQRNLDHLWSGVVNQNRALLVGRVLEQFLAKIVAERISHHQSKSYFRG